MQLFTCFFEEGCVAAGSLWEKTPRYILLWTIKYFLWWFLWDMKAATLQKNKHPASADNVVFSSMIDTFITQMNIKFIHVKWSTWSSFKVLSSWLRLFIFLSIICLIQQKETVTPISRRLNKKGNKYRYLRHF